MARVIRRTPLEIYVKDYLKSHKTKFKANFDMLRKAAVYIDQKIAEACCDPENPVIDLFTKEDNTFIHTVWTILKGMSRVGNIQSLTRARDAILNYIAPPCCVEDTTAFTITGGPSGTVHSASNPYGFAVTAEATGPYAENFTHIDLYIDGVLKQVSLVNPGIYAQNITNAVGTVAHSYYFIAHTEAGVSVQSATTNFTLVNP